MEIENQALCLARGNKELLSHSVQHRRGLPFGFRLARSGMVSLCAYREPDRKTWRTSFALEELFQQIHPNNKYLFKHQSLQYRTHGDIWDYLYLQAQQDRDRIFTH